MYYDPLDAHHTIMKQQRYQDKLRTRDYFKLVVWSGGVEIIQCVDGVERFLQHSNEGKSPVTFTPRPIALPEWNKLMRKLDIELDFEDLSKLLF